MSFTEGELAGMRETVEATLVESATVVRRQPTGRDPRGNTTWSTTRTVYLGRRAPRPSQEGQDGRVGEEYDLRLPHDAVVGALDDVEVGGETFQVDGEPVPYPSPSAAVGLRIRLRRVGR